MKFIPDEEQTESINLTPLIDIVFLLLIFFLTATTFQKEEVEMDLELPQAASGEAGDEKRVVVINVARDGRVLVDGRVVSVEALRQKLKAAATRDKDQQVLIRGDKQSQFGVVAQVFDACLLAKLHSVSIVARPEDSGPR